MPPIAALPMYDWPERQAAHDAFWREVRKALIRHRIAAPQTLDRSLPTMAQWSSPRLLLGQTCGWPWATRYRARLALVAAPIYDVAGCDGATYTSAIVVRQDAPITTLAELRGATVAFNSNDSQSGVHALREALASFGEADAAFFSQALETGSHRASLRAVAGGAADCAAIDAVCLALAGEIEPETCDRLRTLCQTRAAPALPFVTARKSEGLTADLRAALNEAVESGAGGAIFLRGIAPPDEAGYLALPERVAALPPLAEKMSGISDGRSSGIHTL